MPVKTKSRLIRTAVLAGFVGVSVAAIAERAAARPPVSPYQFRRVFERHRSSLVQVRDVSRPTGWRTGFLVGARGELVFGSRRQPENVLKWRGDDGVVRSAKLLSYDRKLRLAVARGPIRPRVVPLLPADEPLQQERWVVTLRHGKKGQAIPNAGVVQKRDRRRNWVVEVPAQIGAPILDTQGRLLGVVRGGGRRKAVVVPMRRVLPFLKKAVLGESE